MTGRPSKFSQKIAAEICERLVEGESLATICETDHMPAKATVFRWLAENEAFQTQYAHARDAQADTLADEILQLADGAEDVQKAKLQIDSRKWIASKLKPKKYGDKMTSEITGPDGGMPKFLIEVRGIKPPNFEAGEPPLPPHSDPLANEDEPG